MSEQTIQSKKITVGLVLSWIFGVLFALTGILSIFSEPVLGLVMLIMAAVLLPPVTKLVEQKWKFHLSKGIKIGIVVIGFIILGATIDTSGVSTTQQTETQKEEDQNTNSGASMNNTGTIELVDEEQQSPTSANTDQDPNPTKIEDKPVPAATQASTQVEKINEQSITPKPSETVSQKNAVRSAKSYLRYSSFSRDGLVAQLEYEQFSHSDAVYGADNSDADWNEQAAKSAKQYMEYSAFSRGRLIDQLLYEKFTREQAEYGANAIGL